MYTMPHICAYSSGIKKVDDNTCKSVTPPYFNPTWEFCSETDKVYKTTKVGDSGIKVKFTSSLHLKTQHLIVGGPYFVYLSNFLEMVDYVSSDFLDFLAFLVSLHSTLLSGSVGRVSLIA